MIDLLNAVQCASNSLSYSSISKPMLFNSHRHDHQKEPHLSSTCSVGGGKGAWSCEHCWCFLGNCGGISDMTWMASTLVHVINCISYKYLHIRYLAHWRLCYANYIADESDADLPHNDYKLWGFQFFLCYHPFLFHDAGQSIFIRRFFFWIDIVQSNTSWLSRIFFFPLWSKWQRFG